MTDVRRLPALTPKQVAQVSALADAATEVDGVRPFSEHVALHLRTGGEEPGQHLLVEEPAADGDGGSTVVGYAHLDPTDVVDGSAAELVVHPQHRRRGRGRALVRAAEAASPDGRLRLWAHGDQPAARALATGLGYREVRQLWQMRRSLWGPLPEPVDVDGVRLRAFRPGVDDEAWLALNARAFAEHPEQGAWTSQDLHARMAESWFDPQGFLLAVEEDAQASSATGEASTSGAGALLGFVWTKVHGGGSGHGHAHDPIGEIYVVGVDPDQQGRRLGRLLTVAGLRWLRAQGLAQAMLYVDADNKPAVALYDRLGFAHWDTDVMFRRGGGGNPPPT